jgi:hypothetical protein
VRKSSLDDFSWRMRGVAGPVPKTGTESVHSDADPEAPQHHFHGHVGERFTFTSALEQVAPGVVDLGEKGDSGIRKWNAMFFFALHAGG